MRPALQLLGIIAVFILLLVVHECVRAWSIARCQRAAERQLLMDAKAFVGAAFQDDDSPESSSGPVLHVSGESERVAGAGAVQSVVPGKGVTG